MLGAITHPLTAGGSSHPCTNIHGQAEQQDPVEINAMTTLIPFTHGEISIAPSGVVIRQKISDFSENYHIVVH